MKELNLTLHCGAQLATLDEVNRAAYPEATHSYTPLPHESFINRLKKQLSVEKIEVSQEKYALGKDGARMFGLMELAMPTCPTLGFSNILGVRNSHDKKFPAGFVIGSQVFVCDNLAFSGSIKVVRRHTKNLLADLAGSICSAVEKLATSFNVQGEKFEAYKAKSLSRDRAAGLILEMAREGVINKTDILNVDNEFRKPSHEEFEGETGWSFFNATTEILKGRIKGKDGEVQYRTNVWDLPQKTEALHRILDVECEVVTE